MFINRQHTSTTMQWGKTFEAVTRDEINQNGPIHTSLQHAFNGIYFDVRCKELLPIKYIEIRSISVRGDLGDMAVYQTRHGSLKDKHSRPEAWCECYRASHEPSMYTMCVHCTFLLVYATSMWTCLFLVFFFRR